MIKIINQPHNDEFSLRLFFKLLEDLKTKNKKFDAFYSWSTAFVYGIKFSPDENHVDGKHISKYIIDNIKEDLVILGLKDHFTNNFNPWIDPYPQLLHLITDIFDNHRDKKFIVFTSLENLESYINYPNVTIIPWGGDITNQMTEYRAFSNKIEKNLLTDKIFLNINRHKRHNRILTLSAIASLNIERNGLLSCMFKDELSDNLIDYFDYVPIHLKEHLTFFNKGYNKLKTYNFDINDDYKIYNNNNNTNTVNFEKRLKPYYQNTFVELVAETSFYESAFLVTEKTQNCIYGGNFPIWITAKGFVSFLRNLGLDVFDDIIDHSYDNIDDPFLRLHTAITSNQVLLSNIDYVKNLWVLNKDRFEKNIDFLNNNFYQLMYDRATNKFISCTE